jgi:hypothetical protein
VRRSVMKRFSWKMPRGAPVTASTTTNTPAPGGRPWGWGVEGGEVDEQVVGLGAGGMRAGPGEVRAENPL